MIRCLFHRKVSIFLSSHSFHPAFCHSRMPEGSSANLSWTRTSTWTVLRVLRRLIGEHEASDPPICLIFQEWKIFKCCRCCFIFYALVRVTVPLVTFHSQTRRVFDKLSVDDYHANCTRLLCETLFAILYLFKTFYRVYYKSYFIILISNLNNKRERRRYTRQQIWTNLKIVKFK